MEYPETPRLDMEQSDQVTATGQLLNLLRHWKWFVFSMLTVIVLFVLLVALSVLLPIPGFE